MVLSSASVDLRRFFGFSVRACACRASCPPRVHRDPRSKGSLSNAVTVPLESESSYVCKSHTATLNIWVSHNAGTCFSRSPRKLTGPLCEFPGRDDFFRNLRSLSPPGRILSGGRSPTQETSPSERDRSPGSGVRRPGGPARKPVDASKTCWRYVT